MSVSAGPLDVIAVVRAKRARLLSFCFLALGVGAGLGSFGVGGASLAKLAAPPLVLIGAAYPWIVFSSPTEPSPVKVLLLSALFSPVVAALAYFLARAALGGAGADPAAAAGIAFLTCAAAQLLAWSSRLRFEPLGKAAWIALGLTFVLAFSVALAVALGSAPRFLHPGADWHVTVAAGLERAALENPFLAGTESPAHPLYAGLVIGVARLLGVAPSIAMALLTTWAAATVPLSIYLWAAPLYRESRRVLLAPLLAVFGWNALGALRAVSRTGLGGGVGEGGVSSASEWVEALGVGSILLGPAAWMRPGPEVWALACAACAGMCAAHALRHAGRPWVGLTCCSIALCALTHAALALALAVAVAIAVLAHPGKQDVRGRVTLELAAFAVLVVGLLRVFAVAPVPSGLLGLDAPSGSAVLEALALGALAALGLIRGRWRAEGGSEDARGRSTILLTTIALAACPVLAHAFGASAGLEQWGDPTTLLHAAGLGLGVLAAGGVIDLMRGRGLERLAGLLLLATLLTGAIAGTGRALAASTAFAGTWLPVEEHGLVALAEVEPEEGQEESTALRGARELARAYAWLRARPADEHPVLLVAPGDPRFDLGSARELAALFAGMPLWVSARPDAVGDEYRRSLRYARWSSVFSSRKEWDSSPLIELDRSRRVAYAVVQEVDRRNTARGRKDEPLRGVDVRLLALGFTPAHEEGTTSIYRRVPGAGVGGTEVVR